MEHGADVNAKAKYVWTPLHYSAEKNAVGVARLLIDGHGVDVNLAGTDGGVAPLHIAAGNDAHEMVQLLIDRGADVWAKSGEGAVPLNYAIWKNARNAGNLLVNNVIDKEKGRTPCIMLCFTINTSW